MTQDYQDLIDQWAKGQEKEQALLSITNKVRDIPFQFIGTRDIKSMLNAGVGTCNAKHMLLKELAVKLGYPVRFKVDQFYLSDFLTGLDPKNEKVIQLKKIASNMDPYCHTYLQVFNHNRWVSVDITFDSTLEPFGFVVATDWDGETDTKLPHTPLKEIIVENEPGDFKKDLLRGESEENKNLRKEFFKQLNDYLMEIRSQNIT